MEIKLFQAAGWEFCDAHQGSAQDTQGQGLHIEVQPTLKPSAGLQLLQRFDFSSEAARCTVVVRGCNPGAPTRTFVKGSPEIVRRLVEPSSVPADFDAVLDSLAHEGYRWAQISLIVPFACSLSANFGLPPLFSCELMK